MSPDQLVNFLNFHIVDKFTDNLRNILIFIYDELMIQKPKSLLKNESSSFSDSSLISFDKYGGKNLNQKINTIGNIYNDRGIASTSTPVSKEKKRRYVHDSETNNSNIAYLSNEDTQLSKFIPRKNINLKDSFKHRLITIEGIL